MNEEVRQAYGSCLKPGFLPCCRLYRSEVGISSVFADVVPLTVTLRKDLLQVFQLDPTHPRTHTPFLEVRIVPFEESMPEDVLALAENPPTSQRRLRPIRDLFRILLGVVEQAWSPNKFHFIMHSSGHDSRLLSWAIKYLYEKNGPSWLGDVLFGEWDCESEPFKQIMEVEGWSDSQWAVYKPETAGTREYHADSLEFKHAWKRLNGQVSIPLSMWCDSVRYFQEQGVIPNDDPLQCWNGQFANEIMKFTDQYGSLTMAIRKIQDNVLCTTTQLGDFVWPYLNLKWIIAKHTYGRPFGWHQSQLVEAVAPQLTHIPRIDSSTIKRGPCRRISDLLLQRALEDFEGSWYAKNTPLIPRYVPSPSLAYSNWWGHWGLASLCEHLLEQGHTIKMQE